MTPLWVAVGFTTGLAMRRSGVDVDWGTAGEWAGAFGTVAAVAIALVVAINDSRRRDADRKDEQAAQARLITIETEAEMVGCRGWVKVTNRSTSPVFGVEVEAIHVTPDVVPVRFQDEDGRRRSRLDPDESLQAFFNTYRSDGTLTDVREPNLISADVSFIDSAGLRWRRWGNTPPRGGAPIEHRDPPPPVREIQKPGDD
jgi:hypothetical protein